MDRYTEDLLAWRQRLDQSLRREEGWLSLAGLFWLDPGENPIGSAGSCPIRLPAGPASAGSFHVTRWGVEFQVAEGVEVLWEGEPVRAISMQTDTSDVPTRLALDNLTLGIIQRGERIGLRVWDRQSEARTEFPGRAWFPVDPAYRFNACLEAYPAPRPVDLPDVSGGVQSMNSPGEAVFAFAGEEHRLQVSSMDEDGLFLIFQDATNGTETYPAGRYLTAPPPEGGEIVLDFNRAYNPPCAFTPFATCPLPPASNRLPIRIEVGERLPPST